MLIRCTEQSRTIESADPEDEQLGCAAIDEEKRSWTALMGSNKDGALMWLSNNPIA